MKIWVIGRSYPMPINKMQGSFELEQAKMLAKHGHDVSYLACVFHPYKKVKKWGYSNWQEDKVNIFTNSIVFAPERFRFHLHKFKSNIWDKFLKKVEKQSDIPDIIHVHYPTNITVAKEILKYKKYGTKIVCTEHWTQVLNKTIDKYEIKQLKSYVENANYFLAVGEALRKSIYDLTETSKEVLIIENIVNDVFEPVGKVKDDKRFRFVAVGNQVKHKRFDLIINSFAKLLEKRPNARLTLVGGGPEHEKLIKLSKELEIYDKIDFTGVLSRKDTAKKVALSDCLICFSDFETFGVPIIESWACGNPVIIRDTIKILEDWNPKLGMRIEGSNIELSKAMITMIDNYKNYDKTYIYNFAKGNYSESAVYKKLISYYLN